MKILIDIGHPAHIHFFKNIIKNLKFHGHNVIITATETEIIKYLLHTYGFDFYFLGKHNEGILHKAIGLLFKDLELYKIVKKFQPDLFVSIGSEYASQIAYFVKKPSIIFTDTEVAHLTHTLTSPFVSVICTPQFFKKDFGEKHVRINGYKELAYLHPNQFIPNPAILQVMGLKETDPFIIIRFVSWGAAHDIGHHGIRDKIGLVKALENYGRVKITSEGGLPAELKPYLITIPPEKLHDLLAYATLYVGEGGTMASEAAVLGTHAIHISTTAKYCGNFSDLNRYELLWTSENDEDTIKKAIELLQNSNLKSLGRFKRDQLLNDKLDVTAFMTWFIEKYPESVKIMKENPDFQNVFKTLRLL